MRPGNKRALRALDEFTSPPMARPATVAGDMEEFDRLTPEQLARLDELLGDERSPLMPLERGLLFASRLVF